MLNILKQEFLCTNEKHSQHKYFKHPLHFEEWTIGCDASLLVAAKLSHQEGLFSFPAGLDKSKWFVEVLKGEPKGTTISRDALEVFCGPHRTYEEAGSEFEPPVRYGEILKFGYDLRRLAKMLHFMPPCEELIINDAWSNLTIFSKGSEIEWRAVLAPRAEPKQLKRTKLNTKTRKFAL